MAGLFFLCGGAYPAGKYGVSHSSLISLGRMGKVRRFDRGDRLRTTQRRSPLCFTSCIRGIFYLRDFLRRMMWKDRLISESQLSPFKVPSTQPPILI